MPEAYAQIYRATNDYPDIRLDQIKLISNRYIMKEALRVETVGSEPSPGRTRRTLTSSLPHAHDSSDHHKVI